jgi:IclR family transcriptional regulator, pca regulon regulatory protein
VPASKQAQTPARNRNASVVATPPSRLSGQASPRRSGASDRHTSAQLSSPAGDRPSSGAVGAPAFYASEELGAAARYSSSLMAGLSILECFSAERPRLGIAALAQELHMSRPTTHRYASTLVALGYLEQDHSRQYRLAARGADFGLALLNSMALRSLSHERLRRLRGQTGHTVAMAILDGADIRYIHWLRGWRLGQHAVNLDLGVGARLPSHCTAMGKALLAYLPESTRERLIGQLQLLRRGPNSITGKRELRAELKRVRVAGVAVNDEELASGLRTIAAPVLDAQGLAPAAISVSVPCETFSREDLLAKLGPRVVATAMYVSAAMQTHQGANPPG